MRYFIVPMGICSAVSAALAYFFVPTHPNAADNVEIFPHLMTTAIAISGVTVPLIILYRQGATTNIRIAITDKITAALRKAGLTADLFLGACVNMRADPANSERLLLILEKAYVAEDQVDPNTGKYAPLPPNVKTWLLESAPARQRWFAYLFDIETDQSVCGWYLYALVAFSILCFADLYVRFLGHHLGGPDWLDGATDRFLMIVTFGANLCTYMVLGRFSLERHSINELVEKSIRRIIPQVLADIRSFEGKNKDYRRSLNQRLSPKGTRTP
jgi:hypothetical protein